MIKRYLVIILLFFACAHGYAQSLSFDALTSLTNMNTDQVHNYLLISKGFKSGGTKLYKGINFEIYRSNRTDPKKAEVLSLRPGEDVDGNMSRQVIYFTLRAQDINALLVQTLKSGMKLIFQGSDQYKKIYCFDNSLFLTTIYLNHDKSSGSVQLQEK